MSVTGTDRDRIVQQLVKVEELLNQLAADLNGHETSRNVPHPVLALGPRGTEPVPGVTDTRFIPEVPQVQTVQTLSSTLSPGLLQNTIPRATIVTRPLLSLSERPGKGASAIRTEVRSQFVSPDALDVSNSDESSASDNESTESRRSNSAVRSGGISYMTEVGAPMCGLYCKDGPCCFNILSCTNEDLASKHDSLIHACEELEI